MDITAIITSFNTGQYFKEAFSSIVKQTLLPKQIIIVDDASTDNTVKTIESVLAELEHYTNNIDIVKIFRKENGGASAARNDGIKAAKGEVIALLDGDDFFYKDKFAKSIAILEEFPLVGMVYSDFEKWDLQEGKTVREFKPAYDPRILAQTCIANTNSLFLRSVFSDQMAGLFNEELRGGEDYDMWIRISRHRLLYHIPEALFCYRMHGDNITIKNRSTVIDNTRKIVNEAGRV